MAIIIGKTHITRGSSIPAFCKLLFFLINKDQRKRRAKVQEITCVPVSRGLYFIHRRTHAIVHRALVKLESPPSAPSTIYSSRFLFSLRPCRSTISRRRGGGLTAARARERDRAHSQESQGAQSTGRAPEASKNERGCIVYIKAYQRVSL